MDTGQSVGDETDQIGRSFDNFDGNRKGHLDIDELSAALEAVGLSSTRPELIKTLEDLRISPDGVNRANFRRIVESRRNPDTGVCEIFEYFDADSDGFVSFDDLRKTANQLGNEDVADSDIRNMIGLFDDNQDGQLNIDEFKRIFQEFHYPE